MRSHQEVEIANFLYLHNIDYEYEPLYRYDIVMAKKPYTPGISVLTDILRGANSQKIKSAELDRIPEYGTLKHIRREVLVNIIDWLIEQKFILKTKGTYPVLHPTYDGMHYAETMTNAKLKKLQVYLMEQSS